ncbi:MAG: hypothetical protein WAU02_04785 [Candidatus Saccharimonadales bacterium]
MADRPSPQVRLYHNPWSETVPDDVLLGLLLSAAVEADKVLIDMIARGEVEAGCESYAYVILDPTKPRDQITPVDRVMAAVLLGPDAERYLPNALAKADAHDRHGIPNGLLVKGANWALGNGDFAWGNSVCGVVVDPDGLGGNDVIYDVGVAAGSGLSVEQDAEFAYRISDHFLGRVHDARELWLEKHRRNGSRRWFNTADEPPAHYMAILYRRYVQPSF